MNILIITLLYPERADSTFMSITQVVRDFARSWRDSGDEICVIRPSTWTNQLKRRKKNQIGTMIDGIPVYTLGLPKLPFSDKLHFGMLRRWAKRHRIKPDVIVAHDHYGILAASALRDMFPQVPIIYGLHEREIQIFNRLEPFLDNSDAIAYRSMSIEQHLRGRISDDKPQFIASSGIDESLIRSTPPETTKFPLRLMTASRLVKKKNIDAVISALSSCANLDFRYDIYGQGPMEAKLKSQVENLGLADRITFHSTVSHDAVIQAMDNHDLFLMPSRPETLGMVYLEAMARGMVVIGSKGWGIDGILEDRHEGFLIGEEICKELTEILQETTELEFDRLRNNAVKKVHVHTRSERNRAYRMFLEETIQKKANT